MRKIEYIVIHTSASTDKVKVDADVIRQWHKEKGWDDIGYHYVILNGNNPKGYDNGTIEEGRPLAIEGAHCPGVNYNSIGICVVGHGDYSPFNTAQLDSLDKLVSELMVTYSVPVENIIGHNEINKLIEKGLVSERFKTSKTCPGKLVDMDNIRSLFSKELIRDTVLNMEKFRESVEYLNKTVRTFTPNAYDEWKMFRGHPEIREML